MGYVESVRVVSRWDGGGAWRDLWGALREGWAVWGWITVGGSYWGTFFFFFYLGTFLRGDADIAGGLAELAGGSWLCLKES